MVTHDYERGVISGLPKSVLDHVRRTGQLPDDAMSVNLRAVWEGLLWQKSHAAEPPGMTVAEILRVRDGWDDAFDPEAWERMTGGKVPFAPAFDGMAPGPGAASVEEHVSRKPASASAWLSWPDLWSDEVVDCSDEQKNRWNLIRKCLTSGFADGKYLWWSVVRWCAMYTKPPTSPVFDWDAEAHRRWVLSPCDCAHTKWLLDDPASWPEIVRADMEAVCRYAAGLMNESGPSMDFSGNALQRCARFEWSRLDFDQMMASDGSCFYTWDGAEGGPCVKVMWDDPNGDAKCDPRSSLVTTEGREGDRGPTGTQASCGCWTVDDFGTDCYCGAATMTCVPEDGACRCTGSCYRDHHDCDWGSFRFNTLKQDCRSV